HVLRNDSPPRTTAVKSHSGSGTPIANPRRDTADDKGSDFPRLSSVVCSLKSPRRRSEFLARNSSFVISSSHASATAMLRNANGRASTWGCRSPRMKLKDGASTIGSSPSSARPERWYSWMTRDERHHHQLVVS